MIIVDSLRVVEVLVGVRTTVNIIKLKTRIVLLSLCLAIDLIACCDVWTDDASLVLPSYTCVRAEGHPGVKLIQIDLFCLFSSPWWP